MARGLMAIMGGSLLLGLAVASPVRASTIAPVSPFLGTWSEGFESFRNFNDIGDMGYNPLTVMGGHATLTNTGAFAETWVYEPTAGADWSLGANGLLATTHSGTKAAGLYNASAVVDVLLTFGTDALAFGGYFTVNNGNIETLKFFDDTHTQIGLTQLISSASNAMLWSGWTSDVGIKSIEFSGATAPAMDDLQANPSAVVNAVPEPASLTLLGTGLAGASIKRLRRRRA